MTPEIKGQRQAWEEMLAYLRRVDKVYIEEGKSPISEVRIELGALMEYCQGKINAGGLR